LPSWFALGNPIVGNPTLRPETSDSTEVSVAHALSEMLGVTATLFRNEFRNIVDFDPGPPPKLVNRPGATTQGGELSATARISDTLRVAPNVSYVLTRVDPTGGSFRNRPKWLLGGTAEWRPVTDWTFGFSWTHVGTLLDSSIPTGDVQLGAYDRVDLSAAWQVTEHARLYLAVQNVLDAQYQELTGFPAPGIFPRLGLEMSF
jgi:vitamin B12 transporter